MRTDSKTISVLPVLIAAGSLLFVCQTAAQTFSNLYNFTSLSGALLTNTDGANPSAGLILSGKTFYGTALFGGSTGNGTVFAINTDGTGFTNLHSFTALVGSQSTNSDGANPYGGLTLSGNTLYGTTRIGGKWGNGTVFAVNADGTGFTNLHNFTATSNIFPSANTNSDGANPVSALVLAGNTLYGTTEFGGFWGNGVVFALSTDGTGFTNLHVFTASVSNPNFGRVNSDGVFPRAGLVLSSNKLYGTASGGGTSANGSIFAVNTDGTGFTNLHSFTRLFNSRGNSDGANPTAGLILFGNRLYGTARSGGNSGEGTVFAINTDGTGFANLHSFTSRILSGSIVPGSDGGAPAGVLVLSSNTLYGTASEGGTTNVDIYGYGTVFAVNTDGTGFTPLYLFSSPSANPPYGNSDGAYPSAGLVLIENTLYGVAGNGGLSDSGTVFSLPVTLRPLPPQFGPIYADFTTATILTNNMAITPTAYFTYNTNFPGSWDIAGVSFGFVGTFDVPATGTYRLTVNHQTSAAASCPGGGYSPINIYINGTQIASNFDPAQQSGGSLAEVTNSWLITATAGVDNTLKWAAGPLCSRYWIEGIQITPVLAPVLSLSLASNNAVLSWNTNLAGFVLESSSRLGGGWSQVSPAPTIVGTTNFTTNTIIAPSQFYRLHNTGF
jgi:uncharacterized repeat protein (TIGR03803 family)